MPHPIWLLEEASEGRRRLTEAQDRKLLWWKKKLTEDVTAGDHISKSKIPDSVKKKYGIDNLWRIELQNHPTRSRRGRTDSRWTTYESRY